MLKNNSVETSGPCAAVYLWPLVLWTLASGAVVGAERDEYDFAEPRTLQVTGAFDDGANVRNLEPTTGFIVHSKGYVLTAKHIIPPELRTKPSAWKEITLSGRIGSPSAKERRLKLIRHHETLDVILLQLVKEGPDETFEYFELAKSVDIPAKEVFAAGFAQGTDRLQRIHARLTASCKVGDTAAKANAIEKLIGGFSGGPVTYREEATVIGVVSDSATDASSSFTFVPVSAFNDWLATVDAGFEFSALDEYTTPTGESGEEKLNQPVLIDVLAAWLPMQRLEAEAPAKIILKDPSSLERFLDRMRKKPGGTLSKADVVASAIAALLLDLSGRTVRDFDRWVNEETMNGIRDALLAESREFRRHLKTSQDLSKILLSYAIRAYREEDWSAAIENSEKFWEQFDKKEFRNANIFSNEVREAKKLAGLSYLNQADDYDREGESEKAADCRGKAYRIFEESYIYPLGPLLPLHTDLAILPGRKERNETIVGWLEKSKDPGRAKEADVRRDRDGLTYLWFKHENGSHQFMRLLEPIESPTDPNQLRLRWRWKLDAMPEGGRDPKTDRSANHPLSVVVGFVKMRGFRPEKIVAIHYLWDPLEVKGAAWVDPGLKIDLGPFSVPAEFPNVVVSSQADELHEWHTIERPIFADFERFYPDEKPAWPLLVVTMQTNCQFGEQGKARVAEGSIGGLMFVHGKDNVADVEDRSATKDVKK
jgi:hypothetical protein